MKRYLMVICGAFIIVTLLLSGCNSAEDNSQTETTTEETTEDEASDKTKKELEYEKAIQGNWSGESGTVIFEENYRFTAINDKGTEYIGDYSLVASKGGDLAISFVVNEETVRVYTGKLSDNTLKLTDEQGKTTELVKDEYNEE